MAVIQSLFNSSSFSPYAGQNMLNAMRASSQGASFGASPASIPGSTISSGNAAASGAVAAGNSAVSAANGAVNAGRDAVAYGNGAISAGNAAVANGLDAVNAAQNSVQDGKNAVSAASGVMDLVRDSGGQVQQSITNINNLAGTVGNDADSIRNMAGLSASFVPLISNQANVVNNSALGLQGSANDIREVVKGLTPYEDQMKSYASQLWDQGSETYRRGVGFYDNAAALLAMDQSVGGLVSKYIDIINGYDPTFKVEQAATDTALAHKNANDAMTRDLARRGVNVSSGAALAARQNLAATYEAALAGAKTTARNQAIQDQKVALDDAMRHVMELAGQGDATTRNGAEMQNAGQGALKDAEGVRNDMVNGMNIAASIDKGAADLFVAAGDMFGKAANVAGTSGELYGAAGKLTTDQADMYKKATDALNAFLGVQNDAERNVQSAYSNLNDSNKALQSAYGNLNDSNKILQSAYGNMNDAQKILQSGYGNLQTAYGTLERAQEGTAGYYANLFRTLQSGGGGGGVQIVNNDEYNAERLMRDAAFHSTYDKNNSY